MGKQKNKNPRFLKKNIDIDADVDDIDPDSTKYIYDEIDHFHAKRQNVDLSLKSEPKNENTKIKKIKFEMPVLPQKDDMDLNYDDDDEEEDDGFNDDEYNESNEVISSSKAWGKKASDYFGAEDVKAVRGREREELEDAEEEEAMKIQQRLAEEIDEDQFDFFQTATSAEEDKVVNEKVDIDIQSLSVKAQWKLVKQESPELKDLIVDFKAKAKELKKFLLPLLNLVKSGKITGNGAIYVQTRFNVYLTYLLNISFYLSLKTKRQSLSGHPVIGRMIQHRTLIHKLSRLDKKLEDDIKTLLSQEDFSEQNDCDDEGDDEADYDGDVDEGEVPSPKKQRVSAKPNEESLLPLNKRLAQEEEKQKKLARIQEPAKEVKKENKREASSTIKKNKGFAVKSKKRLGNPRVRNKEKFRKAKIRRKGQVREYRPELEKYSGEVTGIKAGIIRSRTIL